jgi:uncharacterized membrane protein YeaQ/YmgE (transglycosylase-associated protein family)
MMPVGYSLQSLSEIQASLAHQTTPSRRKIISINRYRFECGKKEIKTMEPMGLVAWVVVGLIAGWLASQVMPSSFGIIGDTVVGMIGALVGGVIFEQFGEAGATGINLWSILVAFVGAVVLLFVIRAVSGRKGFSRR